MTHRGKWFEREFAAGLGRLKAKWGDDFFYTRLLDAAGLGPRSIADYMAICHGLTHLIECKSCSIQTSFPFSYMREHQEQSLLEAARAGAVSVVVVKKAMRPAAIYGLDIEIWMDVKERMIEAGRSSVPYSELEKAGVTLPKVDGEWDLEPIFNP